MIRFVDMTVALGCDDAWWPTCGFFDTVADRFVENDVHCHSYDCLEDIYGIEDAGLRDRCLGLVPVGFFERQVPWELEAVMLIERIRNGHWVFAELDEILSRYL